MDEYYLTLVINFIFKLFLIFITYKKARSSRAGISPLSTVMKTNARNLFHFAAISLLSPTVPFQNDSII